MSDAPEIPLVNLVDEAPAGLVIAIQFWDGDQHEAIRLARLMADIEAARRVDVTIAFCKRFDPMTSKAFDAELRSVISYVEAKFDVMEIGCSLSGGHPDGCNALWAYTMRELAALWQRGARFSSVLLVEPDGVPLRETWIDDLRAEHEQSLIGGRLVTGALMQRPIFHFNGTLLAHLSLWLDRPSLHRTPMSQAWDLFHAAALMSVGRATPLIKNVYDGREWSVAALEAMSRETAWMTSGKDDTAVAWAEDALRAPPRA